MTKHYVKFQTQFPDRETQSLKACVHTKFKINDHNLAKKKKE